MNFNFSTATKIIFGAGTVKNLSSILNDENESILLITGKSDNNKHLIQGILPFHKNIISYKVVTEPDIEVIRIGVRLAIENQCKSVIGIGGGSAIDAGKAISALSTNTDDIMEYLEVIGKGKSIKNQPLRFIAIPTTAGTGSEVTSNAVIQSEEYKVKVSLRSPLMFPKISIIDPELTTTTPFDITVSTGFDALSQLIEPYTSKYSNPLTDILCLEGIKRINKSFKEACYNPLNIEDRTNMSLAALYGGLALSNAKLGVIHGIAGPLGGMINIPHGIACASLLAPAVETNIKALSNKNMFKYLEKYKDISVIVSGTDNTDCLIEELKLLSIELKVPRLKDFGLTTDMIEYLIKMSQKSGSMKGNPIELNDNEIYSIINMAM